MTLTAVVLLLLAAGTHAAWNALGKHAQQTPAFLLVGNTLGALCLLPALALYGQGLAAFSPAVWGWIALTGFFQAVYYIGLVGAYRAGDMSVAYPLLRSLPVLLVALANLWLGRADQLSRQALLGMLAVVLGGVLLPVRRFSGWHMRDALTHSAPLVWGVGAWVLVAALGTTGYSLIDDHALRIVRGSPALAVPSAGATAVFALLEGLAASSWLGLFVLISPGARRALPEVLHTQLGKAALTGIGIHLAYTLVLVAMGFVSNVSYVVAFRQVSIVVGTLLGVTLLREPRYAGKFIGVAILVAGLVLVSLG